MLRVLDLFSGIGGFSLGLERTGGFETVAFCEIDPFCQKVLRKHWPGVPVYSDVRMLRGYMFGDIDVICGGYPCQPFSLAGQRRGAEDDRHLWPKMYRLIQESRPAWVIGENVAGHVSMGLDEVLSDLETADYTCQTFNIPACAVDAPHRRERLWIVAHAERIGRTLQRSSVEESAQQSFEGASGRTENETRNLPTMGQPHPLADARGATSSQCSRQRTSSDSSCGTGGCTRWSPEPNVGRVVARLPNELDRGGVGEHTSEGTREILRALQQTHKTETLQWTIGGLGGLQAAEVLFSAVCEYAGPPKPLGNISLQSAEAPGLTMRSLWCDGQVACASCRRAAKKQRSREYPDVMRLVSQLLACDCRKSWVDGSGTPSASSRVDRLRSLGNAVVPKIPELIGQAILEAER